MTNAELFVQNLKSTLGNDPTILGIAVGGSWITNEMDEFSDVDLVIVTRDKITENKNFMLQFANRVGNLLSGFTGEHVGEPRLLVCLYDDPFLHVDFKFVTLDEFKTRIETPVILMDNNGVLSTALTDSSARFPYPEYQWIEDRFWIWIHYALLKIGRGEYMEAFDFLSYLRMVVLGPLLHIRNGNLPRGVRKVETSLDTKDLKKLMATIPQYKVKSLLESLRAVVTLYKDLQTSLFDDTIQLQKDTQQRVMAYFEETEKRTNEIKG